MPTVTNSLERALIVLDLLRQIPGGLRNAEISRRLSIPKSSCSYITARLSQWGYIDRNEDTARYTVGLTPVALAHAALREIGYPSIAEPALYRLASQVGVSAAIGILERGRVLIVDRVESLEFAKRVEAEFGSVRKAKTSDYRDWQDRDIGRELPVHSTALGRILVAFQPRERAIELISNDPLAKVTRSAKLSKAELIGQLDAIRKQGFAKADGELYPQTRAIAAPIFDGRMQVRAAVSVNGRIADEAWEDSDALISLVKAAARDISKRMWSPGRI
jgi:DNA-binding IclR family transcriptional regulator